MAIKMCTCKYRWPHVELVCVACGHLINPYKWEERPEPPMTFDAMADLVHYLMHGPKEEAQKFDEEQSQLLGELQESEGWNR